MQGLVAVDPERRRVYAGTRSRFLYISRGEGASLQLSALGAVPRVVRCCALSAF